MTGGDVFSLVKRPRGDADGTRSDAHLPPWSADGLEDDAKAASGRKGGPSKRRAEPSNVM